MACGTIVYEERYVEPRAAADYRRQHMLEIHRYGARDVPEYTQAYRFRLVEFLEIRLILVIQKLVQSRCRRSGSLVGCSFRSGEIVLDHRGLFVLRYVSQVE
jgi:hypothetical protein